MKTPIEMLIEQLEEKIKLVNKCIETQDEIGVFMYTGLVAGFMESKVMAEKIIENKYKNLDL
jgi:hypothetical protein